jgi:cytochrome b6-f complex iron-sulfur subunit
VRAAHRISDFKVELMAKRPSVKEILEMARKAGPAKPVEEAEPPAPAEEIAAAAAPEPEPEPALESAAPAVDVPTPEKLGRPLTLKEKLAAARAGGAPKPAAAPKAKPAAPSRPAEPEAEAAPEAPAAPAPAADVPTPEKLGRPLTLKEKLAAARAGGATAASSAAPAKPAAAKPAAAGAAPAKAAATRTLPPLEKMTDPRDLAEALRQTGAKKAKEVAAKTAAAAPAKAPAKPAHKEAKPQTVPPKPSKKAALTEAVAQAERRGFMIGSLFVSFIVLGWSAFAAANAAFALMFTRFMFPNVLAEPPSTIKIGLPTNYELDEVNERFKAEWGFWVVRSTRYDGNDILYALKSVCTHLGCPPNWLGGEQKFKCPCHGSGFYISGINFEGPAPRPLERFKVTLADDGQIVVDKSQIFQQELGQWADADSFIVV